MQDVLSYFTTTFSYFTTFLFDAFKSSGYPSLGLVMLSVAIICIVAAAIYRR